MSDAKERLAKRMKRTKVLRLNMLKEGVKAICVLISREKYTFWLFNAIKTGRLDKVRQQESSQ